MQTDIIITCGDQILGYLWKHMLLEHIEVIKVSKN